MEVTESEDLRRPVALVTGVGRRIGIGAAVAGRLAADGFDVATTWWSPYDARMPWGADGEVASIAPSLVERAAAHELSHLGITANVVNPGATDTGWMSEEQLAEVARSTPLGRVGTPADVANLVSFLCSDQGGWVNGQLLLSDGGAA